MAPPDTPISSFSNSIIIIQNAFGSSKDVIIVIPNFQVLDQFSFVQNCTLQINFVRRSKLGTLDKKKTLKRESPFLML